jgi:hypothetical protein
MQHGQKYEPDMPAKDIEAKFQAALKQVKASRMFTLEDSGTRASSLSGAHGLPKWLRTTPR